MRFLWGRVWLSMSVPSMATAGGRSNSGGRLAWMSSVVSSSTPTCSNGQPSGQGRTSPVSGSTSSSRSCSTRTPCSTTRLMARQPECIRLYLTCMCFGIPSAERCFGLSFFNDRHTPDVVIVCGSPVAWKMYAARTPDKGMSRGRPVRRSAAAQIFLAMSLVATATERAMRCSSVIGLACVASELGRGEAPLGSRRGRLTGGPPARTGWARRAEPRTAGAVGRDARR